MKKKNLVAILLMLSIMPLAFTGCGEELLGKLRENVPGDGVSVETSSKLTKYTGKEYFEYIDSSFYNCIEAAPVISAKYLDGSFSEDGIFYFSEVEPSDEFADEYGSGYEGVLRIGTGFDNIDVFLDMKADTTRTYSIQQLNWTPEAEYYAGEISFFRPNYVRNDEGVLPVDPENSEAMFADNIITSAQLVADYAGKSYSDIVDEFNSIGQLQYFLFDGTKPEEQNIRIMWYCPDEQQVLTLYFNAHDGQLLFREVSNSAGEILESNMRMTTAQVNEVIAQAKKAAEEEELARIEAEKKKYEGVNQNRKMNDTDLSQIAVGDVITFGSYPFENKWSDYINYSELDYIYSLVDPDDNCNYDEDDLKSNYLLYACRIFGHGYYPGGIGFADFVIPDGWEFADNYIRLRDIFPWGIVDDNRLSEAYENVKASYCDSRGCYYDEVYPTYEDYANEYHNDVDAILSNCPNWLYESYDDFKAIFDEYAVERGGDVTTSYQPVTWNVLAVEDGKALLLSHDVLFNKEYYIDPVIYNKTSYEESDIRPFLNEEIYDVMFNEEEQAHIIESDIKNEDSAGYVTEYRMDDYSTGKTIPRKEGYDNTQDKLFLLGYDEILQYCGGLDLLDVPGFLWVEHEYGRKDLIANFVNTTNVSKWWLRNTNRYEHDRTLCVDEYGVIQNSKNSFDAVSGVRPAMWVSIGQ